mmetsp:Transcript_4516/g.10125  ORF Transcript_4516/g.10125 Transcript_4516/m.10125 type:complete len:106 (+) Transcript_4516:115-432(+)
MPSPMSLELVSIGENTAEKIPPPTSTVSCNIFDATTRPVRFTPIRRTSAKMQAGSKPGGDHEGTWKVSNIKGKQTHEAIDMESMTMEITADIRYPLHIMPARTFS